MTNRNYMLDLVRVVAMLGVILDHYLQQSSCNLLANSGLWLGGVSVAIFLVISAYLYGNKWKESGCSSMNVYDFLSKRSLKIFLPLWLTLLVAIPLEIIVKHDVNIQMVVYNILGLGWAKPLMWQGHLWYITMTLFMYLLFLVLSRLRLDRIPLYYYIVLLFIYSCSVILLPSVFTSVSKVIIPLTFIYGTLIFARADKVIKISYQYKYPLLIIGIILIISSYIMYLNDWHYTNKGIASLFSAITGVFVFLIMLTFVNVEKENYIISWLSRRSYEIYLIHPTVMCLVLCFVEKGVLNISIGLILIILAGYYLNNVSNFLFKIIKDRISCK